MNFLHLLTGALSNFAIWAINWGGYTGIFFTMVLEGFAIPIPSEVILPLGGYIASKGTLNVLGVIIAGSVGGTIGSIALYYVSMLLGRNFIKKWGKYVLISDSHLDSIERWFQKYGNFTVFTMRLLPVVRGLISIPAGVAKMKVWSYSLYTFLGSLIWSIVLTYFGFQLGLSGAGMQIIWIVLLILVGVTIGIYLGYRFLKKYLKLFTIITGIVLGSFFVFFIAYALYQAYAPLKINDLNYKNQSRIERINENFKFYVVGNTFYDIEFFDSFLSSISTPSSRNFVVDLGNIVYSGDLSKYRIFVNEIKNIKMPLLTVPGPHDFADGGYKNYYDIFGSFDYTFHTGNTYFIVVNNANKKLSVSQIDWLSDRLSAASTYTHKIIFSHFPIFSSNQITPDFLKSKGVDLIISTGRNNLYTALNVPYLTVGGRKYAVVSVGATNISTKIYSLPLLQSNFNQMMQDMSIYVYTFLVMEWPIVGIIGIAILALWFLWKWYRITIKIEKR